MQEINISFGHDCIVGKLHHFSYEKIIILLHGFTGDMHGPRNIFDELVQELLKNGYSVFQFNFRGTSPSTMDFKDMTLDTERQDLEKVIEYIKQQGYKNISLLGESMGVSLILVHGKFSQFSSIILWYGAYNFIETSFKAYLSEANDTIINKEGKLPVEKSYFIGKRFYEEISSIKLLETCKEISCPVLFMHGTEDTDCSFQDSLEAFKMVSHNKKDIYLLGGEGHCFETAHKKVIELSIDFLKHYF